jgi:hypothetical protein
MPLATGLAAAALNFGPKFPLRNPEQLHKRFGVKIAKTILNITDFLV